MLLPTETSSQFPPHSLLAEQEFASLNLYYMPSYWTLSKFLLCGNCIEKDGLPSLCSLVPPDSSEPGASAVDHRTGPKSSRIASRTSDVAGS